MNKNVKKLNLENNTHLEKIKLMISSQPEEIKKLHLFLKDIDQIYNEYIEITKDYSQKLEKIAMKLKPDGKTIEGQLIQAIQGIILFNSNGLNEMTQEMTIEYKNNKNNSKIENGNIEILNHFYEIYNEQYNKTLDSYKIYGNSIKSYEYYLINKELGLINDNNISTEKNDKNNLYDNHNTVFENQEIFVNHIGACNDILKNLFAYLTDEKNKMRQNIYNYCRSFIDKISSYIYKLNETCSNQKLLLDNLENNTTLENKELNEYFLKPKPYSLKCLTIDENINNNDYPLLKKLNREQALNILQTFHKNGLILNEQDKTKELEQFKKQEISNILNTIINNPNQYTDIQKQKLIDLFSEQNYQKYFLKLLNSPLTKGKFILSKSALTNLGELFCYLNELIIKSGEINLIKQLFIISLSFYYQDKETGQKFYLLQYIENHPQLKNKNFWEKYLDGLIKIDIEMSNKIEKENCTELNYIAFSNVLTVIKNMSEFHLGRIFINEFLDITNKKYKLKEEQIIQINYVLDDSESGSIMEESPYFSVLNQSINTNKDFGNIRCNTIATNANTSSGMDVGSRSIPSMFDKMINEKEDDDENSLESIDIEEMSKEKEGDNK